ncbi:complement component C1q receptor-like [Polypterus senegalus]
MPAGTMWLFAVLWQLLLGAALAEQTQVLCHSRGCYTWHGERASFEKALKNCVNDGGSLVTIKTQEEASDVARLLKRISIPNPAKDVEFWIGLRLGSGQCTDSHTPLRGFAWLDDSKTALYSNWHREPYHTCTSQRCVTVQYASNHIDSANFGWLDRTCSRDTDGYLCQFNFRGMCDELRLAGPGEVSYTFPFSLKPLASSNLLLLQLPFGTLARVSCADEKKEQLTCTAKSDGSISWSKSDRFCLSAETGCQYKNGGCQHICTVSNGSVLCSCLDGYQLDQDRFSCTPIDFCQSSPCSHQCQPELNGFKCQCPNGFDLAENQRDCVDVDECSSSPCAQLCKNTHGGFSCECKPGYEKANGQCEDVDECLNLPCSQDCQNVPGSFTCSCSKGFRLIDGVVCVDIDECLETKPCEQGCRNTEGGYQCLCTEHFELAKDGTSCVPSSNPKTHSSFRDGELHVQQVTTPAPLLTGLSELDDEEQSYIEMATEVLAARPVSTTARAVQLEHNVDPHSSSWVLGSVLLASAVLLLLIAAVISLIVCRRRNSDKHEKNEKKEKVATDKYCWVSSKSKKREKQADNSNGKLAISTGSAEEHV